MPFNNPYFPSQFDVGTPGGPHVHLDSTGVYAINGNQKISLTPQSPINPNAVALSLASGNGEVVPALMYEILDAGNYGASPGGDAIRMSIFESEFVNGVASSIDFESGSRDGTHGTQLSMNVRNHDGTVETSLFMDGDTNSVTLTGVSPFGLTANGLGSNTINGNGGIGQWFAGVGVQATTKRSDPTTNTFAIRGTEGAPNQPLVVATSKGDWLFGPNDSAGGYFPFGISSSGVGGRTKGGISDPFGTITGGPYAVLGGWFAGIGIDANSGPSDATNVFGIGLNNGQEALNVLASGRIQLRNNTTDAAAPTLAGLSGTLYVLNGALRYRGSAGTLTTIANA